MGLSAEVEAVVPEAVDAIQALLRELRRTTGGQLPAEVR